MQIQDFITEGFFTIEDVLLFADAHREKQEILEDAFNEQTDYEGLID